MRAPLLHLLFVLGIGIAMSIAYGFWYVVVSQKSNEVASLENQIMMANENINRIASANAALAEISGDEAKVRSYFVSEGDVVTFINDLESRGRTEKSTVKVLSVLANDASAQSSLLLNISVQGTFDAVMRTIGSIEYAPYDLTVSTLAVLRDEKNAWHANLTLVVGSSAGSSVATSTPQI